MNPHPPLTGIPLAVLLLLTVNEIFYRRTSRGSTRVFLLWCLLGGSVLTYVSGYWGADFATSVPTELIAHHQGYAKFYLLTLCPLILFGILDHIRGGTNRILSLTFYLFLVTSLGVVIQVGSLGGELVFEHGAGVARNK